MWGWPEPCSAVPIADGGRFKTDHYNFEILYTPGHSPDHLCLYEPEQGWLFSGDLFVGGRDRALRRDNDIWQIIASLKKAAAPPLTRLFPGCAQVRENPTQALREKISYLEEIGGKVRELHEKGWPSKKIARKIFGRPRAIELVTGGQFSRRALVDSFLQEKP